MRHRYRILATAAAAGMALAASGGATQAQSRSGGSDPRDARINQLEAEVRALLDANKAQEAKVEALAGQVGDLRRDQAAQSQQVTQQIQTIAAAQPEEKPKVKPSGKIALSSSDGEFTLAPIGVFQFDYGNYFQSAPGPISGPINPDQRRSGPALGANSSNVDFTHARQLKDGDVIRRARMGFGGTAAGVDYRILLDFGGTGVENTGQIYEAWVQYSPINPLRLKVGVFPPPIGMEDAGSTSGIPLMERSTIEDMARGLAAGDTRTAAMAYGYDRQWFAAGAITGRTVGVLNTGTASPTPQTYGDQLGFVGRAVYRPIYNDDWLVHIGVHGSYVANISNNKGPTSTGLPQPYGNFAVSFSNTQELRIDGTKLINTGSIPASHAGTIGPEFAAQYRNFLVQFEYEYLPVSTTAPGIASPHFSGLYVLGDWVLTGEKRAYNVASAAFDGVSPCRPLDPKNNQWGAVELALQYSYANLNFDEGLYGFQPNVNSVRGGDTNIFSAALGWYPNSYVRFLLQYQYIDLSRLSPDAVVYQTGPGANIGQKYSTFAIRSQVAF